MAKITLTDITTGYFSAAAYNANNALIEAALELTLSRDGTTPNTMSAALDMNSNKINNLTDGTNNQDAVTVAQLDAAGLGSLVTPISAINGGTGQSIYTIGDLLYASSTTALSKLGIGSDTEVLTLSGGLPVWSAGGSATLAGLTDVTSAATTARFALMADGAAYVGRAIVEADISDLQTYLTSYTTELSEDTTPVLGGNLDVNGNQIVSNTNGNIVLDPHGTGEVQLSDGTRFTHFDLGQVVGSSHSLWLYQSTPATANYALSGTSTNTYLNASAQVNFMIGNAAQAILTNAKLQSEVPVYIKDSAAANADVAGYGQYWSINETPSAPAYEDDLGTTIYLDGRSHVIGKTASYTGIMSDRGRTIRYTGATASKVHTIPANASVAYPIGTMIGIENDGSVTMTVAITTDTLTWSKDNTTGTRTLAAGASCVIKKTTATTWKISGSALVT